MFEKIEIGLKNSAESIVQVEDTAVKVGSGSLEVLATPRMIALVEKAAADLLEKNLPAEFTSVGISLLVAHTAPTPVGMKYSAEVEIISVDGKKVMLYFEVFDEVGEIGSGTHERFIVNREKFLSKANVKLTQKNN